MRCSCSCFSLSRSDFSAKRTLLSSWY
jgi:hypothetical protein